MKQPHGIFMRIGSVNLAYMVKATQDRDPGRAQVNLACMFIHRIRRCRGRPELSKRVLQDRKLSNFANIESPQFDFLLNNQQITSEQKSLEMLGIMYWNLPVLSKFRLDHKQVVSNPECPCRHSFFRPKRFNNSKSYSTKQHARYIRYHMASRH